ncbi:MAG: PAS domain S-box protein [Ruminococcaceae bacterium]|nr:PAS domain S-box protein [Oscillospiraceae bacterium]
MSLYSILSHNCRACYKCVRSCPVGAIRVRKNKVTIDSERCIRCGICYHVCGHDAIRTSVDVAKAIDLIEQGRQVFLLMNPAILGVFDVKSMETVCAGAKLLGFAGAASSAEGAAAAFYEYLNLAETGKMKNIILSACPSVNQLIEKYYPELADQLAPVSTPMISGARLIKKRNSNSAVIYCGACLAGYDEASDVRNSTEVDGVISFSELADWFESAGVDLERCGEASLTGNAGGKLNVYPIPGGMSRCLRESGRTNGYHPVYVDGIENCIEVCEEIKKGRLSGCFIEMNACFGGCVGGSSKLKRACGKMETCLRIQAYVEKHNFQPEINEKDVYFKRPVITMPVANDMPDDEEIAKTMQEMGLDDPTAAINCGACGYGTCREKAIAVLRGETEQDICMTLLRRKAERVANFAVDAMPLIAIIVDQQQRIIEFNQAACRAFGMTREQALKKYIFEIMDPADFLYVLNVKLSIQNKKLELPEYGLTLTENMAYMKDQDVALGLFIDVTAEQKKLAKRRKQAERNMAMAQKVIDKQMTVAQQIASLLGETTAETKLTLDMLKAQLEREGEE